MSDIAELLDRFGRTTGDYWSKDNAQFEDTNPTIPARIVRAVNPMTALGSALGAMHDAAGKGFPVMDTGEALLQSLPLFGTTKVIQAGGSGVTKGAQAISPDLFKTLISLATGAGISVGADIAQAPQSPKSK